MSQTLVNIRMDEDVKKEMEKTRKELGITMSSAFNMFARKLCREKRIPFEVSIDPFYSKQNIQAIKESINQLSQGKTIGKSIDELEAMDDKM